MRNKDRVKNKLGWLVITTSMIIIVSFAFTAEAREVKKSTIIVAGDYNFPPYESIDADGEPEGYLVDLTQAIAKIIGLNVEIGLEVWEKAIEDLEKGQIDVVQAMPRSEELEKLFDFSSAHTIVTYSIFIRKGQPPIKLLEDIRGKKIIVKEGGAMHNYVLNQGLTGRPILVKSHVDGLQLLASGKYDCAVFETLSSLYLIRKLKLINLVTTYENFYPLQLCYAVKKGNTAILDYFNKGIEMLEITGKYREIYDKWFGVLKPSGIPQKVIIKYSIFIFTSLILILLSAIIWFKTLRMEVAQKTKELKNAQDKLIRNEKLVALGKLAGAIGHELRNPLGVIRNSIYFLRMKLDQTETDGKIKKHMDILEEEINITEKVINDILTFGRLKEPILADTDINNTINEALKKVKVPEGIEVSLQLRSDLRRILSDETQLMRVFYNIILNAIQAIPKKGSVVIASAEKNGFIEVDITDTGEGISEENLKKISDPLFSTKARGTGLGLSVCQSIIESHDGSLAVESKVGKGTKVTVRLPITTREV